VALVPPTSRPRAGSGVLSGALSTVQLVSGNGVVVTAAGDVMTYTPVTFNPSAGATATCTVALSPDNVTYSTLGVVTEPVGVTFDGTIHLVSVQVPAGWFLRMTVVNAVLGVTTFC